jgi:hypothetical protein
MLRSYDSSYQLRTANWSRPGQWCSLAEQAASERVAGAINDDVVVLGDGAQLKRVSEWRVARGVQAPSLLAIRSRDQLQRSKARMPGFADDDVIMHRHSERAGDVDDRLGVDGTPTRRSGGKKLLAGACAYIAQFEHFLDPLAGPVLYPKSVAPIGRAGLAAQCAVLKPCRGRRQEADEVRAEMSEIIEGVLLRKVHVWDVSPLDRLFRASQQPYQALEVLSVDRPRHDCDVAKHLNIVRGGLAEILEIKNCPRLLTRLYRHSFAATALIAIAS